MEGTNSTSNNSSRSGLSISSVTENNGGPGSTGQVGWFIDSHNGNIKEQYHFIEKLASGGFGVVYLAEHRKTSKKRMLSDTVTHKFQSISCRLTNYLYCIEVKYAIKAIQKKRVKDYLTFQNEIKLLRVLVSNPLFIPDCM